LQKRAASETRPLLLIVSWLNPHDIYSVADAAPPEARAQAAARLPSNLVDDLRGKPFPQRHYLEQDQGKPFVGADRAMWRRYRAFYNALVETVDREIGAVLGAVRSGDVAPITVFSTDHGDLGGAHGLPYKGPAMYEELVRIPLVILWPGRIRAARSDALVSLIDLLPTLCDLTGVPPPTGVDGLSLRPVLIPSPGSPARVREMVFAEYYGKQAWRVPIRMVRTARWKYVRYLDHGEELYDLDADPGELRNLAGEPSAAAERARLARELDEWIRRTQDPFPKLTTTDRSGSAVTGARGR
jgi:choline-sulfatase